MQANALHQLLGIKNNIDKKLHLNSFTTTYAQNRSSVTK